MAQGLAGAWEFHAYPTKQTANSPHRSSFATDRLADDIDMPLVVSRGFAFILPVTRLLLGLSLRRGFVMHWGDRLSVFDNQLDAIRRCNVPFAVLLASDLA